VDAVLVVSLLAEATAAIHSEHGPHCNSSSAALTSEPISSRTIASGVRHGERSDFLS
jgi:hypothetical protein